MTIEQAKQIRLEDFLQSFGHTPVRRRGIMVWYFSPLRNERTPSFKVNAIVAGSGENTLAFCSNRQISPAKQR